jgi:hypothetical protein
MSRHELIGTDNEPKAYKKPLDFHLKAISSHVIPRCEKFCGLDETDFKLFDRFKGNL